MSDLKSTLYITFDGLSDPLGQSQILPYLTGIAKNGYQIHILSCEKKSRLEKEETTILELIKDLPITWQHINYDENGNSFSRFSYIKQLEKLANQIRIQNNIQLIHCRSYLASLIGLKFKLKHTIPFVFDMRGFWADERIDGGIWKKNNLVHQLFYKYFKKKEKQFIENSNAIVSLTLAGLKEMQKQYGIQNLVDKTTIIPCCTNVSLFTPEINGSKTIEGINENDHVIVYAGSIGTWYYTKEMIDCIIEWQKRLPNIKLLVLTKDTEELNHILSTYNAEQKALVVSASASYKEMPSYLAMAKASMFFIKPAYSKIASSPTKMAECWSMNLPIITNVGIGDNDLYFNTHKGGVLIHEFTSNNYQIACEKYVELLKENNDYRDIALNFFDTQMAVKKYTGIYNTLVK